MRAIFYICIFVPRIYMYCGKKLFSLKGFLFIGNMNYNFELCKKENLKLSKLNVLDFIVTWIQTATNKKTKIIDGITYYWINASFVSDELGISYSSVIKILKFLEEKNFIHKIFIPGYLDKSWENKLYVSVNYQKYMLFLSDSIYNKSRIEFINKELKGDNMNTLFEVDKPRFSKEADAIAKLILKKYANYFSHRIPTATSAPTKTYISICRIITDIYNGNFTNSRIYSFSEKFTNNKFFKIDGWKDKIKAVKGNWLLTRKLILSALKNFILMHDEERLPYNKNHLQTNLNLFFYDNFTAPGEGQSQFIQCLFEPPLTKKYTSELKADKIFDSLSNEVKKGGNALFELNTTMPSGLFWEKIQTMVEWGNEAFDSDSKMKYFISSGSELPLKFAEYCKEKDISVSISTIDIKEAVECSGPWTWFIKDAIIKHDLNSNLVECVTPDDFVDCYGSDSFNSLSFNDMEEIPVF